MGLRHANNNESSDWVALVLHRFSYVHCFRSLFSTSKYPMHTFFRVLQTAIDLHSVRWLPDQFVNFIYRYIHMHKLAMYSNWFLHYKKLIEKKYSFECVYSGHQLSVLRILIAVHCDRNLHQHWRRRQQQQQTMHKTKEVLVMEWLLFSFAVADEAEKSERKDCIKIVCMQNICKVLYLFCNCVYDNCLIVLLLCGFFCLSLEWTSSAIGILNSMKLN